jgi:hypothetical protein
MKNKTNNYIEHFQQQGFFTSIEGDLSQIAEEIISASESSYFGNIKNLENEPLFEQILLSYDKTVCWFVEDCFNYDLSDTIHPEMYVDVLKKLASISKGLFIPEKIETKTCGYCEGRDQRLIVNYSFNNEETELVFCADGWALMLNFLDEINETLVQTEHSFEVIIDSYGACFVFFLNQQQKNFLLEEMNWNFITNTNYWLDKALYYKEFSFLEKCEHCFTKASKQNDINAMVSYAVFLKEQNRQAEALHEFEKGIMFLNDPGKPIVKRDWWLDFISNQIQSIKKEML